MRIDIITLFPELFTPLLQSGIIRRAFEAQGDQPPAIELHLHNPRDFALGNYRRVDDRPFGGGPGMLMMAEPLALCVQAIQDQRLEQCPEQGLAQDHGPAVNVPVILFSPIGQVLQHDRVAAFSPSGANSAGAILICGRYEGLDQRFIDAFVTEQISLGDFVLSGGEIAAMALLDALARLQPGVLGDDQSHLQDSFNPSIEGLLDCPHYTRPEVWRGQGVPEVLLSGNHALIEQWRQRQRQQLTQKLRPELLPDQAAPSFKPGNQPRNGA